MTFIFVKILPPESLFYSERDILYSLALLFYKSRTSELLLIGFSDTKAKFHWAITITRTCFFTFFNELVHYGCPVFEIDSNEFLGVCTCQKASSAHLEICNLVILEATKSSRTRMSPEFVKDFNGTLWEFIP